MELHNLLFRLSLFDEGRYQSNSPLSKIIANCETVGKDTEFPKIREILPKVRGNSQPVLGLCQVKEVKNQPGSRSDKAGHVRDITTCKAM